MARIETDPNYSDPTFSRGTVSTDLFKKEDLELLSAAVSTHNHDGAGHGLAVAFGTIPANTITGAMIANGTVTYDDLANGAATHYSAVYGSSTSPTTTSTSAVDLPDMTVTINCPVDCLLRADFAGTFVVTVGSGFWFVQLAVDGNAMSNGQTQVIQNSALGQFQHVSTFGYYGVSAGTHTIKAQWFVSGATTLQAYQTYRTLSVEELRR